MPAADILGNQGGGSQGPQGAQGPQGYQGSSGAQGSQGAAGPQGNQGFQGVQGSQGFQGSIGAQGPPGADGADGIDGTDGVQGFQGYQGFQGNQGNQGFQGASGAQGGQGTPAPTNAEFVTTAASGDLSAEVVIPGLAGSADIEGTFGGGTSEEYDTSTTGLTWTPSTPNTVDSDTTRKSHLYIKNVDGTERFGYKSWSPAGAFDVRCEVSFGTDPVASGNYFIGLVVANSGNTERVTNFLIQVVGTGFVLQVFTFTGGSYTQRGSSVNIQGFNRIYLRITRDGSNNISWWFSMDGYAWQGITTFSFTFTPANVGFSVLQQTSTTNAHAYIDWLRTDV